MKSNKKRDIVLCGVGGQGVLTVAGVLASAAMDENLVVRQSEVHGMAQRGGAVVAHVRMDDSNVVSDLIPGGTADLILAMEPLEALRYGDYLAADGVCVTALDPFPNIANYPDREWIDEALNKYQRLVKVPADKLAKEAGTVRARNMVMVGAASRFLPIAEGTLEAAVTRAFAPKGERIMSTNLTAFRLGRDAALSTASVGE